MHNWQLWVKEITQLCEPSSVYLCNGTDEEYRFLCSQLENKGFFVPLNPDQHPNSFWCHSHPDDVARVEECTFICSKSKEDAGPTNNWREPAEMKSHLLQLFKGCMKGRVLYVIPFSMGPLHSSIAQIGIQITDSPYVVCNMHIMTRMGTAVLEALKNNFFVPCLHSVGIPLKPGQKDMHWPCNPKQRVIAHFPEERAIWSFGSGYGGNALLGKKCLALRIASVMGRDQGWLAEHMLILGLTNPTGKKRYIAAAFPSSCGKTNLAMLTSTLPGWRVECVGDDIAWMKFGADGRLYAINPETGCFGVAPGTSVKSNPNAMAMIAKNTLFTNVALTPDRDVWWEGLTEEPPPHLTNWLGEPWTKESKAPAAHPNGRFTAPIQQCPIVDPAWEDPNGVPISAIIFGGRRAHTIPLIYEALNWQHGTFIGACLSSETTAAAKGEIGKLRHDPFAMLPFCGYHMGDYFAHWLEMGRTAHQEYLPRIFHVNWFRKSRTGEWLWPGFGQNIRILKWIFERCEGSPCAQMSPIGYIPAKDSLDLSGLSLSEEVIKQLFLIDKAEWVKAVAELKAYFSLFANKLPEGIKQELAQLEKRLA